MSTISEWRSTPLLTLKTAAAITGLGAASLYRARNAGRLEFRRLAGRTLITNESLVKFVESAEPWSPSTQGAAARAKRAERAAQAWAD